VGVEEEEELCRRVVEYAKLNSERDGLEHPELHILPLDNIILKIQQSATWNCGTLNSITERREPVIV
jgi:hypothetical protein